MTVLSRVLVGREGELSELDAFLHRAVVEGEALVVTGEAGMGKTSLLAYAAERADAQDLTLLAGSGTEVEVDVGFAVLHQLLYPHRARLATLERRHRDALAVCLGLADGPPPLRSTVGAATVSLLAHLARDRPTLVMVDDLHWVDRPSADALAVVAHSLAGQRIGFLAAVRPGARSFFDHGTLPDLPLGPMPVDESTSLLMRRDPHLPASARQRVLAQARGNPLALVELPLDARIRPAPVLSTRLRGLFAPRIQELPDTTRAFLLLAALDSSGELGVIRRAAGDRHGEADVRLCVQRGLVRVDAPSGSLTFAHPLVRSTVVETATWMERRAAHQALAAANGDQLDRRAHHLAATAVGPDESVAGLLEGAAQVLLDRGDAGGAVSALVRSAELSALPRQRARRLSRAAYLGANMSGDLDRVSTLVAQARREMPNGEQSLETAMAAAFLLLNEDGDVDTSHRVLVAALRASEPGEADDQVGDTVRTEAVLTLLWICFFAGRRELWQPFTAELARLGPAASLTLRLCAATFATPTSTGAAARPGLRAAIAELDLETDPRRVALVSRAAFYVDELAGCRPALWKVASAGDAPGTVTAAIDAWVLLGFNAFLDGHWDEAIGSWHHGLALSEAHGYELLSWPARYGLALVAVARGQRDASASLGDQMLRWAEPRGVRSVMAYAHHAAALSALGQRDFETAYRHASEMSPPGVIDPALAHALWLMLDLVDAAVHSGRHAEAAAHVEAMRAVRVGELSGRYALVLAGCEAMVAPPDLARREFERALGTPEADRWPFELARIQLSFGEHLRRIRVHTEARTQLLSALEGFTILRADPWVTRARSELRAGSARRGGDGSSLGLTGRELEVAALAATGLTNPQIGQRIGVSPRTVAAHLSRVLAKLQLTSRAAIGDALAAAGLGSDD